MKGQSRYMVGVAVMAFAVSFYALNNFAVEYVLQTAMQDMDDNFDRYESAVHSYTIVNDGVDYTSNVINQTEFADDITTLPGYDNMCKTTRGIDNGGDYKIWFLDPHNNVKSGDCSRNSYNTYTTYGAVSSYGLIMLPRVYPVVQFWGTANGGKVFYLQTRVK